MKVNPFMYKSLQSNEIYSKNRGEGVEGVV
jgi:hypothetical protein